MRREDLDRLVDVVCPECDKPRQVKVSAFKGRLPDCPPPFPKTCRSCMYKKRTISDETKAKIREKLIGKPKPASVRSKIQATRLEQQTVDSPRLAAFLTQFSNYSSHDVISVQCDDCPTIVEVTKTSALEKIKKRGAFRCRSCGSKQGWVDNPMTDAHREAIRQGRKKSKHSDDTKKKLSEVKKALYQTDHGANLKKKLSEKAAKEHSTKLHENSRRRGIYPSDKNGRPMPFGSSYELKAILMSEDCVNVVSYESQIYFEIDGRHRCLDLLLRIKDGKTIAVEVKPFSRLGEEAVQLQISDSKRYAETLGYEFQVWTETDLGFQTPAEATKWADEFMSKIADQDFVEARKQMNRAKALKHYEKTKEEKKVRAVCACNGVYFVSPNMYKKNVQRNGVYVCKPCSDRRPKPKKRGGHV